MKRPAIILSTHRAASLAGAEGLRRDRPSGPQPPPLSCPNRRPRAAIAPRAGQCASGRAFHARRLRPLTPDHDSSSPAARGRYVRTRLVRMRARRCRARLPQAPPCAGRVPSPRSARAHGESSPVTPTRAGVAFSAPPSHSDPGGSASHSNGGSARNSPRRNPAARTLRASRTPHRDFPGPTSEPRMAPPQSRPCQSHRQNAPPSLADSPRHRRLRTRTDPQAPTPDRTHRPSAAATPARRKAHARCHGRCAALHPAPADRRRSAPAVTPSRAVSQSSASLSGALSKAGERAPESEPTSVRFLFF